MVSRARAGSFVSRVRGASLAVAVLLAARPAVAQPSPNTMIAEQLFREGERLFKDGKLEEACAKFAASNKLDPAPGTLQNLALCHEKQGKTASAWLELNELAGVASRIGKKDREKAARDHAAQLESVLSRVRIHVADGREIAKLDIDTAGVDVAALAIAFPIDPGEHSVHCVDRQGHEARVTVVVPKGPATTTAEVSFVAEAKPPVVVVTNEPLPPPPKEEPHADRRTAGFALIGAGAGGVVAGGVLGLLANAHRNDKPNDDAFTFATAADVAFGVGLAAAAAGAALVLLAPKSSPSAQRWTVGPLVARDGAGLRLGGTF